MAGTDAGLLLEEVSHLQEGSRVACAKQSHVQGQTVPVLRVEENLQVEDAQAPAQDHPNSLLGAGDWGSYCQGKHSTALCLQVTTE